MKTYHIDIQKLSTTEWFQLREQLEVFAFMIIGNTSKGGTLTAYDVHWYSKEDFYKVIKLPKKCDCWELR